jgi:hypothetical protein
LETGRSSWTAPLDVVRLGPVDDATAAQLRAVIERLIAAGQWRSGHPDVLIVADAGYNITRLAVALTSRMPLDLHRWNYRQARRYALPLSTVSS